MPLPLAVVFAVLIDPRRETANKRHQLTDILTIAVCAVLSGADSWEQMAEYGRRKEAFFRRFLALPHGIPSHDTFYRVFAALDPDRLLLFTGRSCVLLFVQGPCLSDPIKEQIHRLQSFGRPGNASEEEKRHRLSKDLLEKNAYTHISFVPASKTGVKIFRYP